MYYVIGWSKATGVFLHSKAYKRKAYAERLKSKTTLLKRMERSRWW